MSTTQDTYLLSIGAGAHPPNGGRNTTVEAETRHLQKGRNTICTFLLMAASLDPVCEYDKQDWGHGTP